MLSFLLIFSVLGSLIGGVASVAKAVSKATRDQLKELQCHDRMNRIADSVSYKCRRGLCLGPYKRGQGIAAKKKPQRR